MILVTPLDKLDEVGREWVEERAGIFEFDAGAPSSVALRWAELAYAYHKKGRVFDPLGVKSNANRE